MFVFAKLLISCIVFSTSVFAIFVPGNSSCVSLDFVYLSKIACCIIFSSEIATLSFACSFIFIVPPIDIPEIISNTIIVITNAINVIPLFFLVFINYFPYT